MSKYDSLKSFSLTNSNITDDIDIHRPHVQRASETKNEIRSYDRNYE